MKLYYILITILFLGCIANAQHQKTFIFKKNNKYGLVYNKQKILPPIYDSIILDSRFILGYQNSTGTLFNSKGDSIYKNIKAAYFFYRNQYTPVAQLLNTSTEMVIIDTLSNKFNTAEFRRRQYLKSDYTLEISPYLNNNIYI